MLRKKIREITVKRISSLVLNMGSWSFTSLMTIETNLKVSKDTGFPWSLATRTSSYLSFISRSNLVLALISPVVVSIMNSFVWSTFWLETLKWYETRPFSPSWPSLENTNVIILLVTFIPNLIRNSDFSKNNLLSDSKNPKVELDSNWNFSFKVEGF